MQAESSNQKKPPASPSKQLQEARARIAFLEATLEAPTLKAPTILPMVPVAHLFPNPFRIRREVSPDHIRQLALSIKETGLLNPVVVRKHPDKADRFQIIKGEMRWRAHQELGKKLIKISVTEVNDEQLLKITFQLAKTALPLSDFERARLVIKAKSEPGELDRTCRACGLPPGGLDHLLAFERLPRFVIEQLERTPRLISATAAGQISTEIEFDEQAAMSAIRRHWGDLIDGITDDIEFAERVSSSARIDPEEESDLWSGC